MSEINKQRHTEGNAAGLDRASASSKPFGRVNYILMAGCLALIIIGFALMAGPGSSVDGGFNPDIFSTRRIVVGPTIAFLGFLCMAFAIIKKPGSGKTPSAPSPDNNEN